MRYVLALFALFSLEGHVDVVVCDDRGSPPRLDAHGKSMTSCLGFGVTWCVLVFLSVSQQDSMLRALCLQPGCPLTSLNASLLPDPSVVPNLDYHQDNRLYYRRLLQEMRARSPFQKL